MSEEDKTSGGEPETKPKVVAKKRRKKAHLVCDRTCGICKTTCDTPFFPEQIAKKNK